MTKRALITGITGQDGSYLAEFLLDRGYEVFGLIRRSSAGPNLQNIEHIIKDIQLLQGDMTDSDSLKRAIKESRPTEIYNLAAQSFVPMSWASPTYTINCNLGGFTYLLEAIRDTDISIKCYQASTSEMFGNTGVALIDQDWPGAGIDPKAKALNEESAMRPRSPYGVSKLAAHRMCQVYRESFNLFVCSGILFNHESPRRGTMFVTRKITKAVADIYAGRQDGLTLGDMSARRDWGFAQDYVRAMWLMLQQDYPEDFVIGTGVTHSVEDCVVLAFQAAASITKKELPKPWDEYVTKDELFMRPAEIYLLRADARKAVDVLGWRPAVAFDALVRMMVKHDLEGEGVI